MGHQKRIINPNSRRDLLFSIIYLELDMAELILQIYIMLKLFSNYYNQ